MSAQAKFYDKVGGVWMSDHSYFVTECLVDSHEKPSLACYDNGAWCYSCQKTFSYDYLNRLLGSVSLKPSRPKQYKLLPRWKMWEDKYETLEGIAHAGYENYKKYGGTFYNKRKLDDFVDRGMFGILDQWATIPVFSPDGEVIDLVVRSIRQKGIKYALRPNDGASRVLYSPNWLRATESDFLMICYGLYTSWSFEALGLPVVTGLSGKSLPPEPINEIAPYKSIYIVPDVGEYEAGYALAEKLGYRAKVPRLEYGYGITDPDDIRRQEGMEVWKERLQTALHGVNSKLVI